MKTFNEEKQVMLAEAEKFRDAAFPVTLELQYESDPKISHRATSKGVSKREHFAGLAMLGMLSGNAGAMTEEDRAVIAETSVMLADNLLNELNKKINR